MPRYRMTIAYDGTPFSGWQRQPATSTVQGWLDRALTRMCGGEEIRCHGASRTDAGVHAEGQVAVFSAPERHSPQTWHRGLNALTPDQIIIREVAPCADDFHPRFESCGKHYRYELVSSFRSPPALRDRALSVPPLDLAAMQEAATHLVGQHDFTSFRAAGCDARNPVRTISRLNVTSGDSSWAYPLHDDEARRITIDVVGNAFLKYMVRNMVGTLVEIGRGHRAPEDMPEILAARDRGSAGRTAAARGLTLLMVFFNPAAFKVAAGGG